MRRTVTNEDFEKWLAANGYKENTSNGYIGALRNAGRYLGIDLDQSILSITDIDKFDQLDSKLRALENFDTADYDNGHRNLSNALQRYREYLISQNGGSDASWLFSNTAFQTLLAAYKKDFTSLWSDGGNDEKYKLAAVQHFQECWKDDVDISNFSAMLVEALSKTGNLLNNQHQHPRDRIQDYAAAEPEDVMNMFKELYAVNDLGIEERVQAFKAAAQDLYNKHLADGWKTPDQTDNAITTYLWLRYPDQYYIYRYNSAKALFRICNDITSRNNKTTSISVGAVYEFYNDVRDVMGKDSELDQLFNEALKDDTDGLYYRDPARTTMTIDLAYYADKCYGKVAPAPVPPMPPSGQEAYDADTFLDDVYMTPEDYNKLTGLLARKKNVILQGPPGVGKTYAAKRLAYSIMNANDPTRVRVVQFHQSYSYEDFIEGYRPLKDGGFELRHGAFYAFCETARKDKDRPYFFIIDEINRGNLSKIFGELFMLIESDKRGDALELLYSGELFSVPENLYIIGLMNTADRSLAMLDYALRRRFAFFKMEPQFDSPRFREYQEGLHSVAFDAIIRQVKKLNDQIAEDPSLREGFKIGHSYFCNLSAESVDEYLPAIVEYELIPLLDEYWFDNEQKRTTAATEFDSALKTKGTGVQQA